MTKSYKVLFILLFSALSITSNAQVIISQYYEGNGTNKWIELTNMGTTAVNTASPQLKLGLWAVTGTTGNIKFQGSATQTVNLTVTIPAKGTVLIGNTGNGTEVPYLTAASAAQSSNTVINFDGNDGIALLNSSNTVIDRFGQGINAANISYIRNSTVTAPTATFSTSQWTVVSISAVQTAATNSPDRLGFHTLPTCIEPLNQATALAFGAINSNSIAGSFTNSASADGYIVVRSSSASLSSNPVDGSTYTAGNSLGGGIVVSSGSSNSFSATGLNSGNNYYFFVFAYKNLSCNGGPNYLTSNPLIGNTATTLPNCIAPAAQPTSLSFSSVTNSSMNGSFSGSGANEYLVVSSTSTTLSSNPVNGTIYNAGNSLGGGTIVSRSTATSFSLSGLNANTTYYIFVFALNNTACIGGPVYLTTNPLSGNQATPFPNCVTPVSQATGLTFSGVSASSINGSFNIVAADEYLVVRSTSSSLSANPVNGTVYNTGNTLGGGTIISRGTTNTFSTIGLNANTTYYFFVFALNNNACAGGPVYLTTSPLSGSQATPLPDCVTPASQPTALSFSAISSNAMNGSFTGSGADEYLVVYSTNASLSSNPVNGMVYNTGNTLGGGTVASSGTATSFSLSVLNANTTYYVFIFAINNAACIGGPLYQTINPLSGNQTTLLPNCIAPASQATALIFSGITANTINGSFTGTTADEYLVIQSTNASLSANPIDGFSYTAGNIIGGGTVIASSSATTFSSTGLSANSTYYYFVFALNSVSCNAGPAYFTTNPLISSSTTTIANCTTPASQASGLIFSSVTTSSMNGNFVGSTADEYLVVISSNNSLSALPVNGTVYNANDAIGGGTVLQRNASTNFNATGLNSASTYYFYIFSLNSNCANGPVYLTAALTGSQATDAVQSNVLNFYNGNLHSHSSYSDGNADNTTRLPADDYAFAKTALCMDFLGISEHNHATAGMHLADWQPGIDQATAATTPNFIALHGMEWGVIGTTGASGTNAGHVIVYGMDSLIGWEANNYQIYVAKNNYTGVGGLFEILIRHGGNALAYGAHPDNYDYNNILNNPYNVQADNIFVGSAVESGPAFSTDTNYTNPGTSMSYFSYYKNMLSKGYHIGPTIDHDNHNYTFGHTTKSRLIIMANSLSENNLLDAMRKLRFYASQDCGAKINFSINTQPLGSILRQAGSPVISVNTITTAAVSSIKLMYGVPGSGTAAITLTSTTASSLNYTHTALANLATGYYFIDITETNGARVITAPIWYTRDDLAARPSPATSFITLNELDRVILKWITTNETNNQQFEMERSADGRNFATIGSMQGKGKSTIANNYVIEDMTPVEGIAYYRLLQKDVSGKTIFSDLKVVDRGAIAKSYITVYPNPVHGLLNVKLVDTQNETSNLDMYDMAGRLVKRRLLNLIKGEQNIQLDMSNLDNGTYILKIRIGKQLLSKVVNKF